MGCTLTIPGVSPVCSVSGIRLSIETENQYLGEVVNFSIEKLSETPRVGAFFNCKLKKLERNLRLIISSE